MPHIDGYADFLVEDVRVKLGYDAKDNSHDDEVLTKLTAGEKLSKSKHLKPKMNLYSVNFIHYAPKGSEEGIYGYIVASDDESVYEWIKSEPKLPQDKTLWNCWADKEEVEYDVYDDDYNVIGTETFKEQMIRLHGDMYDEDADIDDAYYGVTLIGWSLIKEGITDSEIDVLKSLNIII